MLFDSMFNEMYDEKPVYKEYDDGLLEMDTSDGDEPGWLDSIMGSDNSSDSESTSSWSGWGLDSSSDSSDSGSRCGSSYGSSCGGD